ncbi:hypothetical protein [Candidatus Nitrospira salsa]
MTQSPKQCVPSSWRWIYTFLLTWIISLLISPTLVSSNGFQSPEECLAYDNGAHLNCLYAYIEIQQDKIVKLETQLNTEKRSSQQLQDDVHHQHDLNNVLQQQIKNREDRFNNYRYPRIRSYSGLYYGFGPPRYYRRFFQPHLGFHAGQFYPDWYW